MDNLQRYALGDPIDFAAMNVNKFARMWLDYNRGTTHRQRTWMLVLHLALVACALAGALWGLLRGPRRRRIVLVLLVIMAATVVNAFFVAEPRHNLRLMPALLAAGAAGLILGRRPTSVVRSRCLPAPNS